MEGYSISITMEGCLISITMEGCSISITMEGYSIPLLGHPITREDHSTTMEGYATAMRGPPATMQEHSSSPFTAIIRSTSTKTIIEAEVEVVEETQGEVDVVGQ